MPNEAAHCQVTESAQYTSPPDETAHDQWTIPRNAQHGPGVSQSMHAAPMTCGACVSESVMHATTDDVHTFSARQTNSLTVAVQTVENARRL